MGGIGVKIQGYHGDNAIFIIRLFDEFTFENNKSLNLCVVASHHQNIKSEQVIWGLVCKYRFMILREKIYIPTRRYLASDLWNPSILHS